MRADDSVGFPHVKVGYRQALFLFYISPSFTYKPDVHFIDLCVFLITHEVHTKNRNFYNAQVPLDLSDREQTISVWKTSVGDDGHQNLGEKITFNTNHSVNIALLA